jgi:hypothetical protein
MLFDPRTFLPLPEIAGVCLTTGPEPDPIPVATIVTKYETGKEETWMSPEAFDIVTGVSLSIDLSEEGDPTKSEITMTVIHDCSAQGCPTFTKKVRFTIKNEIFQEFKDSYERDRSFLWICSTPIFTGRIVVSKPTSRVVSCVIEDRLLH